MRMSEDVRDSRYETYNLVGDGGSQLSEYYLSCCYLPSRHFRKESSGCGEINRDAFS